MREAVRSSGHLLPFFFTHPEWDEVPVSRGGRHTTSAESGRLLRFRRTCDFLLSFRCNIYFWRGGASSPEPHPKDALNLSPCVDAEMCTTRVCIWTHLTRKLSVFPRKSSHASCNWRATHLVTALRSRFFWCAHPTKRVSKLTACRGQSLELLFLTQRSSQVQHLRVSPRRHNLASKECHCVSPISTILMSCKIFQFH